jgi:hypothetical protein
MGSWIKKCWTKSKGKIIKTKFLCKTTMGSGPYNSIEQKFTEGKWYDGEYETWGWKDGYECNNGWRRYWIVNDVGVKEEIQRTMFNAIFETDIIELRDNKINEIIK